MAESITEGTLKTWTKQVGDSVAADEEVATIETDKIDVSVNAPQSGKIVELLAQEEDTVTVGQDLFRIEPGEYDLAASSSKPEPEKQQTKEEPEQLKKEELKKESKDQVEKKQPVKESDKRAATEASRATPGNRNETRVRTWYSAPFVLSTQQIIGENEPDAFAYR